MSSDILSTIYLVAILVILLLAILFIAHKTKPRLDKHYFVKHWKHIESMTEYSMAVLKADSLLDEALRKAGIKGGTMGERLNNSVGFLRDVNSTWSAHKLRNKIAHENGFQPSAMECQRAIRQIKKALKDLGAL